MSGDLSEDCYSAIIDDNEVYNYDLIKSDPIGEEYFEKKFVKCLSECLKIQEKNIIILGIERGSLNVKYHIIEDDNTNRTLTSSELEDSQNNLTARLNSPALIKKHKLFTYCKLSLESLDPRGNFNFVNHSVENHIRGGFKYFQPLTWKRYGIKVIGRYPDDPEDKWITMDNSPTEWAVGFHGLRNFRDLPPINEIINNSLKTDGSGQVHEKKICTKTGVICGKGAYLTNHIEVAEGYCHSVDFNNKKYIVAFQCRLKPDKIKIPEKKGDEIEKRNDPDWNNDYWIINESRDIRPYGILLKILN
jgi:ribosomal protein S27AE